MNDFKFKITDEARPYLVLQKGALWDLKDDPAAWEAAYNESINNAFKRVKPYLPEKCEAVLDIGSGMGGINALINRHYDGHIFGNKFFVSLLDGLEDAPEVNYHNKTFNDLKIASDFLSINGVRHITGKDASRFNDPEWPYQCSEIYDVVWSFGAWCFHFPPSEYLDFVKAHIKPGTVVIIDVRNNKPEWLAELNEAFGENEVIRETKKFTKRVWRIK